MLTLSPRNSQCVYNACANSKRKEDKNEQFFHEWECSHIHLYILFYHTRYSAEFKRSTYVQMLSYMRCCEIPISSGLKLE